MARLISEDQRQKMQVAKVARKAEYRRVELPRAVIVAYEHGWRMEHDARSEPGYYVTLRQAVEAYLDREVSLEGKGILEVMDAAVVAVKSEVAKD